MSLLGLKYQKARFAAIRALIVRGLEGGEDGDKAAKSLSEDVNPTEPELRKAVRWLVRNKMVSQHTAGDVE